MELQRLSRSSQASVWSRAEKFPGKGRGFWPGFGAQQHPPQAEGSTAQLWLSAWLCFLPMLKVCVLR